MTALTHIARTTSTRHAMLPDGAPMLAMVSGGGDSVALLHLLARGELGAHPLRVLHVNHMLRGDESAADESFVRDLVESLGIDVRVVRYDVAAYAEQGGLNLEDAGRRIRRRFASEELDSLCADIGVPASDGRIAIAHTRDDRVETFFMRAIAGSGTGGLGSIAAVSGRIVRPLIDCDRSDVREWLVAQGLDWREDASNADTDRMRALVRAELMPIAERVNPRVRANLARTMDLLSDDDALLSGMAQAFARDFSDSSDGEVAFITDFMDTLDRTMARRTVREALAEVFPDASRLEAAHIEALVDGLSDESFARDLPDGLKAFREYGRLIVCRAGDGEVGVAPGLLPLPGMLDLGDAGVITAQSAAADDTAGGSGTVVIDAGRAGVEFVVDAVRDGDRMRPLGMDGTRKLSDMLIDAKIPRRQRVSVPVVRDGERIVWLAGVRMSEEYRVTEATEHAFRLTWNEGRSAG